MFLLCALYRFIMDYYYVHNVAPLWAYAGLTLDYNGAKVALSIVIAIVIFFAINWEDNEIYNILLQCMFVVMLMPLLSYYGLANKPSSFILVGSLGFYMTVLIANRAPNRKLHISYSKSGFIVHVDIIATVILIFTVLYMIRAYGIHINAIEMYNSLIYDIRRLQSDVQFSGLMKYLITWSYKIICPLLIALSLSRREIVKSIFFVFLQFIMYLCSPHKEMIFSIVLVVGAYYIARRKQFCYWLVGGLTSALLIETILKNRSIGAFIGATLRRLLFLPASIKYEHFTYFSTHDKLMLSEGSLGRLLGITYELGDQTTGQVIAAYFHGSQSNSNTGYLAYSYDDFGFIGIIVASILVGLLIVLLSRIVSERNKLFILSVSVYPFVEMNDIPLLTLILTGGIAILFLSAIILEARNPSDMKIPLPVKKYYGRSAQNGS